MKKIFKLNSLKFWITILFIYLSIFFNSLFIMKLKNLGDTPNVFILDLPINFITESINRFLSFIVPSNSVNVAFLAVNSLVSVLSFTLNILYYYVLSCIIYLLFNKAFLKIKNIKKIIIN